MKFHHPQCRNAFTLIELLAVLILVAVLVGLLLPAFPRAGTGAAMAGCANNMKQVSLGFLVWVNDNPKSTYPWRVEAADGGTKNHKSGLQNNAWFQYAWLSNELLNPKVLACPADKQAIPADSFDDSPQAGLLHRNYQNQSCSYNLGVDAGQNQPAAVPYCTAASRTEEDFLLSDRNLNHALAQSGSCASGLNPVYELVVGNTQWLPKSNYGHGKMGHVGLCDGSVQKTGHKEFNEIISKNLDRGKGHCLRPRPTP